MIFLIEVLNEIKVIPTHQFLNQNFHEHMKKMYELLGTIFILLHYIFQKSIEL